MRIIKYGIDKIINAKQYQRRLILLNIDIFIILISIILSFNVLFETLVPLKIFDYKWIIPALIISNIFIYITSGNYKGILRYEGEKSILLASYKNLIASFAIYIFGIITNLNTPSITIFCLISIFITIFSLTIKLIFKDILLNIEFLKKSYKKRIMIYGAGSAGAQLAESLQISGNLSIQAFIDDDQQKWGRTLNGIKIISPSKINQVKKDIDKVLLAIPSLNKSRKREILQYIQSRNYSILEIPSIEELASGEAKIDTLKPIDINDLLGRQSSTPNNALLKECIYKKTICVTGGAGSIGSELCRQIIQNNPKKLIIIDKDEYNLYKIESEFISKNQQGKIDALLGDVTDYYFLENILKENKVDIIYHVAAYKHVPLVEKNPITGLKNNVLSTYIVCETSIKYNVNKVILISSDKAVRPTNIMGASKRLAELIVQSYSKLEEKKKNLPKVCFSFVRFGNVLGSSGSVVPLFKNQIKNGGPITLTHENVNRYFMTIEEAAQLIIQASSLALGGEVFLLDMGQPIKIKSLAKKMIRLSGLTVKDENNKNGDIEIIISGLRSGEKLYEELLINGKTEKTQHPLILKSKEPFVEPNDLINSLNLLKKAIKLNNKTKVLEFLKYYVPEWEPQE